MDKKKGKLAKFLIPIKTDLFEISKTKGVKVIRCLSYLDLKKILKSRWSKPEESFFSPQEITALYEHINVCRNCLNTFFILLDALKAHPRQAFCNQDECRSYYFKTVEAISAKLQEVHDRRMSFRLVK